MREGWEFKDASDCLAYHGTPSKAGHCNVTFDSFLCWPLTPVGEVASQPCPANVKGILRDRYAHRTCSENGFWLDDQGQAAADPSWTNFGDCFTPELTKVMIGFYSNISESEASEKSAILYNSRIFEMIGYSISFASILASLCILSAFRKLRTKEKRIHRHLYLAMLIQVVIRLILYTDQFLSRSGGVIGEQNSRKSSDPAAASTSTSTTEDNSSNDLVRGIDNTPYLCESFYVLLEYARSAMFHWFFIEGWHLHTVLTISVIPTHGTGTHVIYYLVGWGLPVLMTAIWAVVTGTHLDSACWYGYNHTNYYYIVEGPRLAVIAINLLFLLNIMRVLLTKLRGSHSSETKKVRKAVRAAIVLQPLLGITNSIQMMAAPYDKSVLYFGIWSYLTTFLVSFQGFFAALFYCFLNGEVREVLSKYLEVQKTQRMIERRASTFGRHNNLVKAKQRSKPELISGLKPKAKKAKRQQENEDESDLPQGIELLRKTNDLYITNSDHNSPPQTAMKETTAINLDTTTSAEVNHHDQFHGSK